nr:RNA-binding protein [Chloroflexota bacterium]
MTNKLFVGNLNYDTTSDTLQALFATVGPVASVAVITDRDTGRSKGFAFIEMQTEEDARKAVTQLDGREVDRRNIKVSEARPQPDRFAGGGSGSRFGGPRHEGGGANRGSKRGPRPGGKNDGRRF